ncbi:FkbM family methyltransferase [SAR202 cluster bacterium AD-802-F09_MRT_200m]|nr:FkbM family methyltransferase [SAR202 cluster bacterium AD-802-F09_MRT_200m]
MKPQNIAYVSYAALRNIARATGLMGPARRLMGPAVGKLLYRMSPGGPGPAQINGHKMILASPGSYPPMDMAMARYEPPTTRLFEDILKPGMAVIDVGAHVGYYTLLAAKQVGPTGNVFSFEPNQDNHALLLKNVELNGYDNVVVNNLAVSDRIGASELYLTALDSGRHSMFHHGLPERGVATVNTTTLDAFLESQGWPHIDLIKIDVEGAEQTVLRGMTRLLESSGNLKLIIELNPGMLNSAEVDPLQFLELLTSLGLSVRIIDAARGSVPLAPGDGPSLVDGLIAKETSINLFCEQR